MKPFKYFIIGICLISCEGMVGGSGYVYTADDDPMDSVAILIYHDGKVIDTIRTDNNGHFDAIRFVGCVPGCPKVTLTFEKQGFTIKTLDFEEYWREEDQPPHLEDSLRIVMTRN